jgi:hypothetical protein
VILLIAYIWWQRLALTQGISPVVFLAGIVVIIGIAIAPSFQQSVTFDSAIVKTRDSTQSGLASAAFTYSGSADYIGENNATRGT